MLIGVFFFNLIKLPIDGGVKSAPSLRSTHDNCIQYSVTTRHEYTHVEITLRNYSNFGIENVP